MAEIRLSERPQRNGGDSEASLRAELLGKLLAAQASVAAAYDKVVRLGDKDAARACDMQLSHLQSLIGSVSTATPAALMALGTEIATSVAEARSAAQSSRGDEMAQTATPSLAAVSAETRSEVQSLNADLFDRHIFDSYLRFTSQADEAEYRRREAETRRYIEEQLKHHSATGDLNAAGATAGQMLDAHAHGAGNSPDFQPRWNHLTNTIHKQREAMHAEGQSTEEFDRNLQTSVRRYLKAKGLTDTEIEARLAGKADPLEVVKPFINGDDEAKSLTESIRRASRSEYIEPAVSITQAANTKGAAPLDNSVPPGLGDVMAKLQSSGIVASSDTWSANAPHHGLSVADQSTAPKHKANTPS